MNSLEFSHFDIRSEVRSEDKTWQFTADDLANKRGITTKLERDVWLDWSDVLYHPEEARMHMYPGASKDVDLGIKRRRMETWQAAIQVFDSMMVNVRAPLEPDVVKSMLQRQKLPRPQYVVLPTGNPSLLRVFDSLNLFQTSNEAIQQKTLWARLVTFARAGALLTPKTYLKKHR